jgi:exopolyphosphatase / guanosine-5'-triphosphate,3'-diphosphate pyrophosphatase
VTPSEGPQGPRGPQGLRGPRGRTVAAIDCGTNSVRLLVAGPDGSDLVRLTRITRLGEGVDATGHLQPGAIARTLAVLEEYARVIRDHQVAAVRATATAAARDADNAAELFVPARELLGVDLELLSGEEEGRLSFAGATADLLGGASRGAVDLPADAKVLVVDVGGGSTELVLGRPGELPLGVVSLPMGCVRITERHLAHDPPTASELAAARADVASILAGAPEAVPGVRDASLLLGLAGTITTLAAMNLALPKHDRALVHHYRLTRDAVEGWLATLASEDHDSRSRHPGLEPARVDTILGGAVVVAGVMAHLGYPQMLVSEADILDGLAASLADGGGGRGPTWPG